MKLVRNRWGLLGLAGVGFLAVVLYTFANLVRLDKKTSAVLAGAERVEVYRIASILEDPTNPSKAERFGGYPVTARVQDQGPEFADELAEILSDPQTYSDRYAGCFDPGIAFRVWNGQQAVEVLICFRCSNFYCGPPTKQAHVTASFTDSALRPRLVGLAKKAFPEDKDIQALSDE